MSKRVKVQDISKDTEQLAHVDMKDLMPLPPPYDKGRITFRERG